jgi:UDP-glucose:(heptosyl)LPS alpha-1,3-glucosyltransferase
MRIAFAIVSLFPWGGLQRDCVRLARLVAARGHEVKIFASRTKGEFPEDLPLELLPVPAYTNHSRNRRFGELLGQAVTGRFDRIVGFDKLPGLDILYCADPCYLDRRSGFLVRLTPRWWTFKALEAACFKPDARTRILAITIPLTEGYRRMWNTPSERMTVLPPVIDSKRHHPELRGDGTRERIRAALGLVREHFAWLLIGSQPQVKGIDRAIEALRDVPAARLIIAGLSAGSVEAAPLLRQARGLGVKERISLLGPREDIAELMAAADLLVHPARFDTSGTVILEAIVNGLPVLATEVCGYAIHIVRADAGIVIAEPFKRLAFKEALTAAADPVWRAHWSGNGVAYGANPKLYSGLEKAADIIVGSDR